MKAADPSGTAASWFVTTALAYRPSRTGVDARCVAPVVQFDAMLASARPAYLIGTAATDCSVTGPRSPDSCSGESFAQRRQVVKV